MSNWAPAEAIQSVSLSLQSKGIRYRRYGKFMAALTCAKATRTDNFKKKRRIDRSAVTELSALQSYFAADADGLKFSM